MTYNNSSSVAIHQLEIKVGINIDRSFYIRQQTGDYFLLVQQLNGYDIYRNRNLLKSINGTSLNYQFGTDGKINSLSATTGANENFISYEYVCD